MKKNWQKQNIEEKGRILWLSICLTTAIVFVRAYVIIFNSLCNFFFALPFVSFSAVGWCVTKQLTVWTQWISTVISLPFSNCRKFVLGVASCLFFFFFFAAVPQTKEDERMIRSIRRKERLFPNKWIQYSIHSLQLKNKKRMSKKNL